MKQWTKMEHALLSDERIVRLTEAMGLKGLGLYLVLRLEVECRGNLSTEQAMLLGNEWCGRRQVAAVLDEYDLFLTDSQGLLRVRTDGPVRTPVRTPVRAEARTGQPMSSKEKENRDIELPSLGSQEGAVQGAVDDPVFDKYRQEYWFPQIADLLSDANLSWREPLLMHCGYGSLLQQYWTEAVLFFVEHVIIQNEQQRLVSTRDCRQYFANFSRVSVPSGRNLKQHLEGLQLAVQAVRAHHLPVMQPVPPDAPPRPSPTAVWNYATDSWTELRNG